MRLLRNVAAMLLPAALAVGVGLSGEGAAAPAKAEGSGKAAKAPTTQPTPPPGEGWQCLFNGKDLTGWSTGKKKPSAKAKKCWQVVDGVIDCTPVRGGQSLWTDNQFGDFRLHVEWRFKETKGKYPMKIILPDGSYKKDANGKVISVPTPNADSGILLRGTGRAQVNLWCWPCGSGELWSVRNNRKAPPQVRAAAVPKVKADKPVGQWNTFEITMQGDRVTVVLNGKTVIDKARIPAVPKSGPIGLQHHGGYNPRSKTWSPASSLIQFRNVWIKPLAKPAAKSAEEK